MAYKAIAIATATAGIALLVFFQLIATFGLPELEVLTWQRWTGDSVGIMEEGVQITLGKQSSEKETLGERQSAGDEYLLGVGKADITGYIGNYDRCFRISVPNLSNPGR